MSVLTRLFPSFLNISSKLGVKVTQNSSNFHSLANSVQKMSLEQTHPKSAGPFALVTRSMVRFHFPRPSERKRVTRHGWKKRMSSPSGRRVLMNRILKGRWVFSH